ncbi:ABC transporter substrate-binding protein [Pseudoroseicyclus aestuarii]|uniref:Iron complex transport system substrate-binding protein n=1 Tax=Pseudoroseicyclus aestuarii TaxID=1795041 RepID=A0A318SRP6_9RHOB|nr:ABC transporter substrate-binding protein [Pseudoroseicyclus aestuarii]PYE84490.1 iron complex transport system substrate-binding protein [Pseudoroseicyclus aestuarii]
MIRSTLALLLALLPLAAEAQPVTVTDIEGREVTLEGPAQRIALAEARQLLALGLLGAEVPERVVALADLRRFDAELQQDWFAAYPQLADRPLIDGDQIPSAEKVIAADPDLFILSGEGGTPEAMEALADTLEAAGIPTVMIDFRADPFANTVPSMRILGQVLGKEEAAEDFIAFYQQHRDSVLDTIAAQQPERPSVFLHMQANTSGRLVSPGEASLGEFVSAAGGENIGASVVPGTFGELSAEYLLAADPDIYLATGGSHFAPDRGVVTGPGIPPEQAQETLQSFLDGQPILSELTSVREGRAHALWHNFHNSPLNVVALEAMASWFHPDLFPASLPQDTLDEINDRFLAVPVTGAPFVSLNRAGQ